MKNEFEIAAVNELSVFGSPKFYCKLHVAEPQQTPVRVNEGNKDFIYHSSLSRDVKRMRHFVEKKYSNNLYIIKRGTKPLINLFSSQ